MDVNICGFDRNLPDIIIKQLTKIAFGMKPEISNDVLTIICDYCFILKWDIIDSNDKNIDYVILRENACKQAFVYAHTSILNDKIGLDVED